MEMKERNPTILEQPADDKMEHCGGEGKSQHLKQACQWLLWGGMGNDGLRLWLRLGTAAGWQRGEAEGDWGSDRGEDS